MEIKIAEEDGVCIVSPQGQLDAITGPELNAFFQETLKDHTNLIADLTGVDFVSSAGLRVFLAIVKEARRAGGDLRLAAVSSDVKKVLSVSGFDRLLKIFPEIKSAVSSYSS